MSEMKTETKATVADMNKVIAEFMGLEKCQRCQEDCGHYKYNGAYFTPAEMSYNCSWDWLMPVGKKIYDIFYGTYVGDRDQIPMKLHYDAIRGRLLAFDISGAHAAVYDFIVWYNQNKQP